MSWLPEDNDRLEILLGYSFGFTVLIVYFTLALCIALGKVQKETSYGLENVLAALGPLGGAFVGWAFGRSRKGIGVVRAIPRRPDPAEQPPEGRVRTAA